MEITLMIETRRFLQTMLTCWLVAFVGCSRESENTLVAKSEIDTEIFDVERALECVKTWQLYQESCRTNTHMAMTTAMKISHLKSHVKYLKYFKEFVNVAFSIPIDSDDVQTRAQQFEAFCWLSRDAALSAKEHAAHPDWTHIYELSHRLSLVRSCYDDYFEIQLRRLERIKDELRFLESRHSTTNGLGWGYSLGRREFEAADKFLSGQFDWWHTAWCISSREKWKEFISRFEKIVGHKVTIGKDIYNEWDMREKEDREREMAERNK